jgi:hypothetical protein
MGLRRGASFRIGGMTARAVNARRRVALLGVFAVLFQAILFGWHHHPLPPLGAHAATSVKAADGGAPLSPVSADDDCDICAALHHSSAAPGEFAAFAPPPLGAAAIFLPDPAPRASVAARAFQARAPPRA